ncbi:uncharacterized protein LOC108734910 isoform X2 [Agrilus planipennis]|uniref:Uncharacterized protein LOC108734910 isoform X2 n=1 Tax=Agrilus planipennis TaxID=224129 RepID=A0A1W4WNY8_AGRPL|nr:uncharacterized protein LOC108734910 isoform X2 [Agrilus planipennis]
MTSTSKGTISEKSIKNQISSISLGSLELGNPKLKSYIEDEIKHQIIVSIREEIIENALNEIYNKYIDNQSVKFVVHCACNALEKIVDLYFYHHDHGQPYYDNHPAWTPDVPPNSSTPDSWAPQYTPMGPKQDISEIDLPEFVPFQEAVPIYSKTKLERSDADGSSESINEIVPESLGSSEGLPPQLDLISITESKKHPSLASLFTTIKTGPKSSLPISYEKVKKKAGKERSEFTPEKICPPYKSGLPTMSKKNYL